MNKKSKEIYIFLIALAFLAVTLKGYLDEKKASELIDKQSKEITDLTNKNLQLSDSIVNLNNDITLLSEEKSALQSELAVTDDELSSSIIEIQNLSNMYEDLKSDYNNLEERSQYIFNGGWNYDYTEEDIEILAGVIYGENFIYGRWEMMLTGSVVLNRIMSKDFPNTVYDVVYQFDGGYEQYAPRTKRLIGSSEVPQECYDLAELLLKYGPVCPPFVVYQAHFNQGKVYWEWEGEEFCYK